MMRGSIWRFATLGVRFLSQGSRYKDFANDVAGDAWSFERARCMLPGCLR